MRIETIKSTINWKLVDEHGYPDEYQLVFVVRQNFFGAYVLGSPFIRASGRWVLAEDAYKLNNTSTYQDIIGWCKVEDIKVEL